jgi:hypothetical protein
MWRRKSLARYRLEANGLNQDTRQRLPAIVPGHGLGYRGGYQRFDPVARHVIDSLPMNTYHQNSITFVPEGEAEWQRLGLKGFSEPKQADWRCQ